jgi:hypothetical protein
MIAIQPVEHLIEAVLGGDRHMAVRLFDLIFDPLRHGGRSAMCGFGFGEKPLDALLGSAEVLRRLAIAITSFTHCAILPIAPPCHDGLLKP